MKCHLSGIRLTCCLLLLFTARSHLVCAQELSHLSAKYDKVSELITKKTDKLLCRLHTVSKSGDSVYQHSVAALNKDIGAATGKKLLRYDPLIDSISCASAYLSALPGVGAQPRLTQAVDGLTAAENKSTMVQSYWNTNCNRLKEQLTPKAFKALEKDIYYYRQQVNAYKAEINADRVQQKLLEQLAAEPAFQSFIVKNGFFGQLYNTQVAGSAGVISGLQTKDQLWNMVSQKLGSNTTAANPLNAVMANAGGQVSAAREKLNSITGGDLAMPDNFKPNSQKGKSFRKRLELMYTFSSQHNTYYLPSITDLGIAAGFKLTDNLVTGIGAAYKLGWGQPFKNIKITGEGVNLKSFVDGKLWRGFWLTGGYELNYLQSFSKLQALQNMAAWQKSGLLGLTRKYKAGKKEGKLQLLWDFLSYYQVPRGQAIQFRAGYSL